MIEYKFVTTITTGMTMSQRTKTIFVRSCNRCGAMVVGDEYEADQEHTAFHQELDQQAQQLARMSGINPDA